MSDDLVFAMGEYEALFPADRQYAEEPHVGTTVRRHFSMRIHGLRRATVAGRLLPGMVRG